MLVKSYFCLLLAIFFLNFGDFWLWTYKKIGQRQNVIWRVFWKYLNSFVLFNFLTGLNWSWFHGALIRPKSRRKWSTRPHSTASKKLLLESKKLFKPTAWTKLNRAALKIYCNKLQENERPKSSPILLDIFKVCVKKKTISRTKKKYS